MDKNTLIAILKDLNMFDENEYFFNYINLIKNISPEEFNYYQNLGFRRGMTKQTSCRETRRKNHTDQNLSKGRIAVHNLENKTKYIFRAQLEEYISKGYVLGGAKRSK